MRMSAIRERERERGERERESNSTTSVAFVTTCENQYSLESLKRQMILYSIKRNLNAVNTHT